MSGKPIKIVGIISMVAGVVMILAGAVTWFTVSSQLSQENITVPADASFLAGDKVDGPFSAYAQAETIKKHALSASDGKTYAELGAMAREAEAAGDTELAATYNTQRDTVMNGSFLRASLFTSVVAFGVAALVVGLGLIFGLIGWVLVKLSAGASQTAAALDRAE